LERKTFQVILIHWDGLKICSEAQAAIKIGRRKLNFFLQNDLAASERKPAHTDASTDGGLALGQQHQRRAPEILISLCRDQSS
jgi:hypothetical protein